MRWRHRSVRLECKLKTRSKICPIPTSLVTSSPTCPPTCTRSLCSGTSAPTTPCRARGRTARCSATAKRKRCAARGSSRRPAGQRGDLAGGERDRGGQLLRAGRRGPRWRGTGALRRGPAPRFRTCKMAGSGGSFSRKIEAEEKLVGSRVDGARV